MGEYHEDFDWSGPGSRATRSAVESIAEVPERTEATHVPFPGQIFPFPQYPFIAPNPIPSWPIDPTIPWEKPYTPDEGYTDTTNTITITTNNTTVVEPEPVERAFWAYYYDDDGMLDSDENPVWIPSVGELVRLKDRDGNPRRYSVHDVEWFPKAEHVNVYMSHYSA
jgi:hypothetical protein